MGQVVFPPELEDLANEIGEFICYWGFKKVHGRIWTHLYLSGEALDAGQLIQRLKVSKALINLSLSDLLSYEVVLEKGKSERGTQTYIANPDIMNVILNVLRRREKKMLTQVETSIKMLTSANPDSIAACKMCPERLSRLQEFVSSAHEALNGFLTFSSVDFQNWSSFNGEAPDSTSSFGQNRD